MTEKYDITHPINSQQRKTLGAIFTDPVNGNIEWRMIESLFPVSTNFQFIAAISKQPGD